MRLKTLLPALATASILTGVPAGAAVLYDNGPAGSDELVFRIHDYSGFDLAMSNSFTLTKAATLTGVELGLQVIDGTTVKSVDWAIVAAPNSYPIQGTAALGMKDLVSGPSVNFTGTFALPDIHLAAGTYYLVLQNATVSAGIDWVYWRSSDGPSAAYSSFYDRDVNNLEGIYPGSNSEAFRILGTVDGVPEPASWAMMIAGFALVGTSLRRRTVRAAFA